MLIISVSYTHEQTIARGQPQGEAEGPTFQKKTSSRESEISQYILRGENTPTRDTQHKTRVKEEVNRGDRER